MENAVEALKIAAAVLIFTIAITVAFTMFSNAKETADDVVKIQDSQEYLEAADLEGKLYISSDAVKSEENAKNAKITTKGHRIVEVEDVISTIYRYHLEDYGVTLISSTGEPIARFDSGTESFIQSWTSTAVNGSRKAEEILDDYEKKINEYIKNPYISSIGEIDLKKLYKLEIEGSTEKQKKFGAPWYGHEKEIIRRINADISGNEYKKDTKKYKGKDIYNILSNAKEIIEVINEIDNSKYLQEELLEQFQLPTVEVVYIIINK